MSIMEEISFDDWSERLDHFNNSCREQNSVWLPAYGFPIHNDDDTDDLFLATAIIDGPNNPANISNGNGGNTTFLVLETIFEENSDELDTSDTESVASTSSSTEEDDVASVIHISPDVSCEDSGSESERDVEVPKKRRKRELNPAFRLRIPSEDDEQSSLSRSSSLLQFESLEKAICNGEVDEDQTSIVFRTSASEKPFVTDSSPPSFSSFSFDSLENERNNCQREDSPIKDSLEDSDDEDETSSDDSSSSSIDDESYFLDRNKLYLNVRQTRLRSYRSFDSLVHVVRPQKLSVSLENTTSIHEENDIVPELIQTNTTNNTNTTLINNLKSSENLSEDSGFGGENDIIKKSPMKEEVILEVDGEDETNNFVLFNDDLIECTSVPYGIEEVRRDEDEEIHQHQQPQHPDILTSTKLPRLNISSCCSSPSSTADIPPLPVQLPPTLDPYTEAPSSVEANWHWGLDHQRYQQQIITLAQIHHDSIVEPISINISENSSVLYNSAPSLILAQKNTLIMSSPSTKVHFNEEEVNEETIQKIQVGGIPVENTTKIQVGGIPVENVTPPSTTTTTAVSPKNSKNSSSPSKFGSFFQRFSFRRKKQSKSPPASSTSQENIITDEAIHSVQKAAEELSNLDDSMKKKSPNSTPPPLPVAGPPKSRLLGIVGRKKLPAAVTPVESATSPTLPPYSGERYNNDDSSKIDKKSWSVYGDCKKSAGTTTTTTTTTTAAAANNEVHTNKKASSLVNLGMMNIVDIDINHDYGIPQDTNTLHCTTVPATATMSAAEARAKSMEFLLDEENKAAILPPENELRKVSERQLSEHELRVQRSLQRLNVPEWYKNSSTNSSFVLKRTGSGTKPGGWQGLSSKTTSLSSLQQSPNLRSKYTRESPSTTSAQSPSPIISPSPQERLSFSYAPFSRWSTSRLNSGPTSANTSPSGSTRSSFHYRQPYLGWRSQEKLLTSTPSYYRTPAERLAANLLSKPPLPPTVNVQPPPQQQNLNEVHSSIKEVTSAIVHYVKEKNLSPANTRPGDLDRSPSPRGSKTRVWVESSFVGSRPIDSPQTPQITGDRGDSTDTTNGYHTDRSGHHGVFMDIHNGSSHTNADEPLTKNYNLEILQHRINFNIDDIEFNNCSHEYLADNVSDTSETNDELEANVVVSTTQNKPKLQEELTQLLENFGNSRPTSATIEDVLDSLLGLPSASRSPSPVMSPRGSTTYLNSGSNTNVAGKSSTSPRTTAEQEESANTSECYTARRHSSGTISKQKQQQHQQQPLGEKTRRVSFELEPINLQREVSLDSAPLDSVPSEDTVKCRYSKCGRIATITEARRSYKTCHNCNSHVYCSRECRRAHWEKGHRKTCLHGRIGALCRRVVNACKEHIPSLEALSKLARRGYLAHGRGCVKVFFSSPELAERFTNAVSSATINESLLPGEPCFIKWADLLPTEMGNEQYKELLRLCKSYNPDTRLTLYVAICVISEVPSSGAVKWERQLITRCSKVRLHKNYAATALQSDKPSTTQHHDILGGNLNITRDMDNPETVILTPLKFSSTNKTRQREIAFTNIQRHLRQRGISLRKQFPEVYRKLCGYVETNDQFTPVTIYPKDSVTGRNFMCIIMPESDPEKLQNIPTDSSRVQTVDIGQEHDLY